MTIPKSVRIGSMDYSIEIKGPLILDNQKCGGIIDYQRKQIFLDNTDTCQQEVEKTLIHEVLHGMLHEYQIDIGDVNEEKLVESLAIGLHQVIKDNALMLKKEPLD